MIPKKIHYCWFGRGSKDKVFDKCLASWQKYFPDWEIIEWNEENFDVNFCEYTKNAYSNKKYAFVSDVARLKIIYEEGGIYFDTDVEVVQKFRTEFLEDGYLGEEIDGLVSTGLGFAAKKGNKAIKIILDSYENLNAIVPEVLQLLSEFRKDDYKEVLLNEAKNNSPKEFSCPFLNTGALIKAGYTVRAGSKVAGIPIYGPEYFCGYNLEGHAVDKGDRTYSVHHYSASWLDKRNKRMEQLRRYLAGIIGPTNYVRIKTIKRKMSRKYHEKV